MFDLNDSCSGRAKRDKIDFVGLKLVGYRESEVSEQDPIVATSFRLQTVLQILERLEFTLVRCRSTWEEDNVHLRISERSNTPSSSIGILLTACRP
jgi:hypothetical protein